MQHVLKIDDLIFFLIKNNIIREWKEKYDQIDNEDDDTLEFTLKNTFIFRPDKSKGLTGEEVITIPHPLVIAPLTIVQKDQEPLMPIVSKAIDLIFEPDSAFLTDSMMNIFFRGFDVDCSSEEFEPKAFCTQLEQGGAVDIFNDTLYKFSFFGTVS